MSLWLGMTSAAVAGLAGSLHCAGMCGPLVGASCSGGSALSPQSPPSLLYASLAKFQLSRLLVYVGLGALAGGLGSLLVNSLALATTQRIAQWMAFLAMITAALFVAVGALWPNRPKGRLVQLSKRGGLTERPFWAGALTALLPCGFLWSFVLIAASTGSAVAGTLTLAGLWLGSTPALTTVGALAGWLKHKGKPGVRRAFQLALAAAMLVTLWVRSPAMHMPEAPLAESPAPSCHGE